MRTYASTHFYFVGLLLALPCTSRAQENVLWFGLDFADVAVVEPVDSDQSSVKITTKPYLKTTHTHIVPVNHTREEIRSGTAIVNGKQVIQTTTVQVPFTVMLEETFAIDAPVRFKPTVIQIKDLTAWDIDGRPVSDDRLADQFSKPTHVFLLYDPWPKGAVIHSSDRGVLRNDVILIHSPVLTRLRDRRLQAARID